MSLRQFIDQKIDPAPPSLIQLMQEHDLRIETHRNMKGEWMAWFTHKGQRLRSDNYCDGDRYWAEHAGFGDDEESTIRNLIDKSVRHGQGVLLAVRRWGPFHKIILRFPLAVIMDVKRADRLITEDS